MNADLYFAVLAELLLKSVALVVAGGLLLRLFRRGSATGRHAVLAAVFISLLLLPATKLMPRRSFLPLALHDLRVVTVRTGEEGEPSPGVESPGVAAPGDVASSMFNTLPWSALACGTWLAGVALGLGRRGVLSLRLGRVVRSSTELVESEFAERVRAIVAASGVRARVRESVHCRVPVVAGVLRPTVLLPADAAAWNACLVESAMRHELGHIRRRDCLTRGLADVICAFYWLNPLVWLAARRLRLAQEQACDDLVLNSGAQADTYAGQLVNAVRRLKHGGLEARHAMAMAQPSTLEARVLAIMDPARNRSSKSRPATVTATATLAVALAMCCAVQVRGEAGARPPVAPEVPQAEEERAEEKPEFKISTVQEPPQPSPGPAEPFVRVASKFVEITGETQDLPEPLKQVDAQGRSLSDPEFQVLIRTLSSQKGVDLLSCPNVVTRSGQKVVVEIERHFGLPSGEGKKVGLMFEAIPTVSSNSSISLHMMPELTEFDGFIDIDATSDKLVKRQADGSVTVSLGKEAKLMGSYIATGPTERGAKDLAPLTISPSAKLKRSEDGHRHVPMFNTRALDKEVKLSLGRTVVLVFPGRETMQTVQDRVPFLGDIPLLGRLFRSTTEVWSKRHLYVFVTADVVKPPPGHINPLSSPHR